jgi:hypothetical protein
MVNVVLSSDEITVLGGPTRLDVDLNIGAAGTRGSIIFNGFGNPNSLSPDRDFPTLPQVFDIFIDSDPGSDNYLQAYQYVNQDGSQSWVMIFKLTQDVYKINKVVEFSQGEANILLNLTELGIENVPFETYSNSSAFFNVSATISNIDATAIDSGSPLTTSPAALSIVVEDAYTNDPNSFTGSQEFPFFLPIKMEAAEFSSGTWSVLDDKKVVVYLTVTFANPNEIFDNFGGES